jgi:photosystem II stability/assembly factor-like uncharacterized protein
MDSWIPRCSLVSLLVPLLATGLTAQSPSEPARVPLDGLAWRHIGPAAHGGRIDDVEAVAGRPSTIVVGTASGGIFKTTNNGVTWRPVFDAYGNTLSIGDLAIAPSDPNIVWAGSGEPNNRQSSSWGDGVYRSLDGGETWTNVGLRDTQQIGRVVTHPTNPDVVFVAALGHLWGPNEERGLFRTRDGGKTWQKVLYVDPDTGVVDVAMDADGRTLFAGAYQRRRRAWGFVGGGPGGGLHRSLDGGDTWQKLGTGLPEGDIGRIGVAISRSAPNIVYAIVEHKTAGGVYRSTDRGATWTRQNSLNPRPMYYSQIRIDPENPEKVWVLGTYVHLSIDGGKTFTTEGTGDRIHVDHHALWINPEDSDHLLLGNDGGLYFSYDGSRTWDAIDNLPIGQYYDIGIDNRDPYWVVGGTQDNGTWGLPSRTFSELGITNADVVNIAYGDGFYTQPDPTDPRFMFANSQSGRTYVVDLQTKEERGIRPVPADPKEKYRFNWSTPLLVSVHAPHAIYYGGNKLFRTTDRGQTWTEISGDLTKNQEWKKLPIMGERNDDTLSRDDGVSDYGTITTVDESPLQAGLLYVGTDDGNVHVTRDAGKTWQDITSRFALPGPRWVSKVLASRYSATTAYVAFDGHQDDDFAPYIFKTADGGRTWTSIAGDMPRGMVVNTLAEHHRNADLLFAGTEFGLFYTLNGGRGWTLARGNLPRVPVDDIVLSTRDNDLVLGTHGRSIIILDDITPLEKWTAAASADAYLFPIRPATMTYTARQLPPPGASEFSAPNPPCGALITYVLKDDPPAPAKEPAKEPSTASAPTQAGASRGTAQPAANAAAASSTTAATAPAAPAAPAEVKITVRDAQGQVVRQLTGPDGKGVHRVNWDLRHPLSFKPAEGDSGWFGTPVGPFVLPGEYTVTLAARGRELAEKVTVRADPRTTASPQDLQARFRTSQRLNEMLRAFTEASSTLDRFEAEVKRVKDLVKDQPEAAKALEQPLADFGKKLTETKEKFKAGWGGPKFSLVDLLGQLQASSTAPTDAQARAADQLQESLAKDLELVNGLIATDYPALQGQVEQQKVAAGAFKAVAPIKP